MDYLRKAGVRSRLHLRALKGIYLTLLMQMGPESGIVFNLKKLLPFSATVSYSQEKLVKLSIYKKILFLYKMYRKSKNGP